MDCVGNKCQKLLTLLQRTGELTLGLLTLDSTTEQKYLGLVFDSQLRWCDQVAIVCKKMSYYVHLVNCHKRELPNPIIKLLINLLVSSHLYYALPVLCPSLLQCPCNSYSTATKPCHMFNLSSYHIAECYNHLSWLNSHNLFTLTLSVPFSTSIVTILQEEFLQFSLGARDCTIFRQSSQDFLHNGSLAQND